MRTSRTIATLRAASLAASLALGAGTAVAQSDDETLKGIEAYRQALLEGNPAELVVARGEELWKTPRGPKKASLEKCDLGLGAGVLKGAYAQLPRYFADTDQVMDAEARLIHCMVTLQGFDRAQVVKSPFSGAGQRQTEIEAMTAFLVEESRGMPISVPQSHQRERDAFERGKRLFYMRSGPYDFACSTCHGVDNQRIRLQDLPNFEKAPPAQRAFSTWPAYRVSQGALRTMQWRLNDCFRQQRWPEPVFISQGTIDLITFLGVKAAGGKMDSPAIKR
jgi:sulfur-oxidizing protein SoxA